MDVTPFLGFFEPLSSLLHLGGALVVARHAPGLVARAATAKAAWALFVFTLAATFLLTMSGVYHMLEIGTPARSILRRLDHAGIWVLIAGTFTPVHIAAFRGWMRWAPLAFIWVAAINGVVFETIFFEGFPEWLRITFYLALGWVGLVSIVQLSRISGPGARGLMLGGVAYSVGIVGQRTLEAVGFVLVPGLIRPHELFHIAVLIGLYFHWRAITRIILWSPAR